MTHFSESADSYMINLNKENQAFLNKSRYGSFIKISYSIPIYHMCKNGLINF